MAKRRRAKRNIRRVEAEETCLNCRNTEDLDECGFCPDCAVLESLPFPTRTNIQPEGYADAARPSWHSHVYGGVK